MPEGSGIKQYPWTDMPVPVPGGTGPIGIGGGLESDGGPNGLSSVPWSNHGTPVPGTAATANSADLPMAPDFASVQDGIAPGTSLDPGAGISNSRNTVDKR
jgi:hypothetical protein